MIILIACAKRQRTPSPQVTSCTQPLFEQQAQGFIEKLSQYNTPALAKLLKISTDLAELNVERYQRALSASVEKYPALDIFDGDVYQAMRRESWSPSAWAHAQKHIRILSGLYGYLRATDGVPFHRLEMPTRLPWLDTPLALFWRTYTTLALGAESTADVVINLASEDYAKAVDKKNSHYRWIDIVFLDRKKDASMAVIGIKAKKARGRMVEAVCKNGWSSAEELQYFNDGYIFSPEQSQANTWVFRAL